MIIVILLFDTKNRQKKKKKANIKTQVRLHQTKKLLYSKGNHQQNEKATY